MPGVEWRRCVQGRPVVVTGGGNGSNLQGEVCDRWKVPEGRGEKFQDRSRGFDEGGGDIARGLVTGAWAGGIFAGVCGPMICASVLLEGAAGRSFRLRGCANGHAAPAHRQSDAEGEEQGCEAGEHSLGQMLKRTDLFKNCKQSVCRGGEVYGGLR